MLIVRDLLGVRLAVMVRLGDAVRLAEDPLDTVTERDTVAVGVREEVAV